jgi:DNA-binding Xre family transcriptional regulator
MRFSYNKLWKLLIDKGMNKKEELREATGLSTTAIAKLGKGENVTTDVLLRICKALECDVCDIMEFIKDGLGNE